MNTDDRYVTVRVTTDLLDVLDEWSLPVQVKIERDEDEPTGWLMKFRSPVADEAHA